jgi:hypothetical protein
MLLLLYLALPLPAAAQDEEPVEVHDLWDSTVPLGTDSLEEWWDRGRITERQVPAAVMDKLKADKQLQYTRAEPKRNSPWMARLLIGLMSFLFRIRVFILILLILALAGLIVFFMRRHGLRLFRKKEGPAIPETDVAGADAVAYARQAQEAIAAGRFRQAVRYLYLQTLWLLSHRQLIALNRNKTNADYLRALLPTRWHRPFAQLTLDYEYVWYGEMAVNPEQFEQIHGQFRRFINELEQNQS